MTIKYKKYFMAWGVFVFGQTWVLGIDAILRLGKPLVLDGYNATLEKTFSVPNHGFPEYLTRLLVICVVLFAVYFLFSSLALREWKLFDIKRRISRSLIFSATLFVGGVVSLAMDFVYVLYTGIDSL